MAEYHILPEGDEMADLRLGLNEDLLRRAQDRASRENTSLGAIISEFLRRWVDDADERTAVARLTLTAIDGPEYRSGGVSWTRDEIHER
jgi:hypothetical protein